MPRLAVPALLLPALLIACGESDACVVDDAALEEFANVVVVGGVNYDPLRTGEQAVERTDAIVVGRLAGMASETGPLDGSFTERRFVFLTVDVEEALTGDLEPGATFSLAYRATRARPGLDAVRDTIPCTRGLFLLGDTVRSSIGEEFDNLPDGPLFFGLADGIWLERRDGDIGRGHFIPPHEFRQGWDRPIASFDDLVEQLQEAAAAP